MLEKLLKFKKKISHLNYIKKVIYMRNKIALLFLSQLLPQEKKRWSNLFEEYPDKVGDPHVRLS